MVDYLGEKKDPKPFKGKEFNYKNNTCLFQKG